MDDLFGKYCYIDTPWIAGEKTRYRIIGSGVRSNAWCEVPVTGRTELIHHDNMEEVVFVVLDTLVSDDSIIRRFALKDVDVMPSDVRPVVLCKDCVMYRRDKELAEASFLDPNYYCGLLQCEMPEDGFCSYGKRRGGDAGV